MSTPADVGSTESASRAGAGIAGAEALLRLEDVNTYYGQIHILQGLSIQVAPGELVCLLGGNASGKSTTLKTILGIVTPRTGVVRLYQLSFLALGLSYGIWLCAGSYAALVVFTLVMGTGYGGYVALAPAVLAHLFGTRRLGTLMGVLWTSTGLGAFAGPPLAGAIIDYTGSYRWAIGFAFVAAMGSFVALIPLEHSAPGDRQ